MVQPSMLRLTHAKRNRLLLAIFLLAQLVLFANADFHFSLRLDKDDVSQHVPALFHLAVNVFMLRESHVFHERVTKSLFASILIIETTLRALYLIQRFESDSWAQLV